MNPLDVWLFLRANWRWMLIATLTVALGVQTWRIDRLKAEPVKTELKAAKQVIKRTEKADKITADVGQKAEKARAEIRYVTRTIVERVPQYVPHQADVQYPIVWGLVRVHDAAATGADPATLPSASGELDGSPSPVKPSYFATVIAENYGQCREDQARLAALQQWVIEQAAAWNRR